MKKHLIAVFACCLFFVGCKDDKVDSSQYDPSQPVVFTDFSPKEGGMRTRLYIEGSNFGSDESKIHITIGGVKAKTIGSDGKKIYCMVPPKAFDGIINVRVEGPDGRTVADHTFEQPFGYAAATIVGTLLRKVDENGNAAFQEGTFEGGASIPSNDCMVFDPQYEEGDNRLLFSSNRFDGLHLIDLTAQTVKRLFPRTGYSNMYSFTFDATGDTLLFTDDHGQQNTTRANIYYALRRENFRRIRPYNYGWTSYSLIYMDDGTVFYTTWWDGKVLRMNRGDGYIPNVDENAEVAFSLSQLSAVGGSHTLLFKHPSNKFIYMLSDNFGAVFRADYDAESRMLGNPSVIAGSMSSTGFQEGTGGSARFQNPHFGVFVQNEKYGEGIGPDKDQYDFYFTDRNNHCIWKLDPYGVATMVAGRSNKNVDNRVWGYVDGDPLHEARFNQPSGLTYDPDQDIFYIGDIDNKGIRYMTTE